MTQGEFAFCAIWTMMSNLSIIRMDFVTMMEVSLSCYMVDTDRPISCIHHYGTTLTLVHRVPLLSMTMR